MLNNLEIDKTGFVILEERIFYSSKDGDPEIYENKTTNERIRIEKIEDIDAATAMDQLSAYLDLLLENNIHRSSVVFPSIYTFKDNNTGIVSYYAVTEFPVGFSDERVMQISKAVCETEFMIPERINAAINLTEVISLISTLYPKPFVSICSDKIYVDIHTGEVFVFAEEFSKTNNDNIDVFGLSPEYLRHKDKELDRFDLSYFICYAVFSLICGGDPFDGKATVTDYPLLTREAVRKINSGNYKFVFCDSDNSVISSSLSLKWKSLPEFLRYAFVIGFTDGTVNRENRTSTEEWLRTVRKLRDSLVFVNGQFLFCDPNKNNRVLYLAVNGYTVPVWNNKALYWYHVNSSYDSSRNGIIAGLSFNDSHGFLKNLSNETIAYSDDMKNEWITPGQEIEVNDGATLRIGEEVVAVIGLSDGYSQPNGATIEK